MVSRVFGVTVNFLLARNYFTINRDRGRLCCLGFLYLFLFQKDYARIIYTLGLVLSVKRKVYFRSLLQKDCTQKCYSLFMKISCFFLLHDNAPAHTAAIVTQFSAAPEKKFQYLPTRPTFVSFKSSVTMSCYHFITTDSIQRRLKTSS